MTSPTLHGPDYDQLTALISPVSPDAPVDAAALLNSGFTPGLLTDYLAAATDRMEASAAAFIRLRDAGISPRDLADYAGAGHTTANEAITTATTIAATPVLSAAPLRTALALLQRGIDPDTITADHVTWFTPVVTAGHTIQYWSTLQAVVDADAGRSTPDTPFPDSARLHVLLTLDQFDGPLPNAGVLTAFIRWGRTFTTTHPVGPDGVPAADLPEDALAGKFADALALFQRGSTQQERSTTPSALYQVTRVEAVRHLCDTIPGLTPGVAAVIVRATQFLPDDRFAVFLEQVAVANSAAPGALTGQLRDDDTYQYAHDLTEQLLQPGGLEHVLRLAALGDDTVEASPARVLPWALHHHVDADTITATMERFPELPRDQAFALSCGFLTGPAGKIYAVSAAGAQQAAAIAPGLDAVGALLLSDAAAREVLVDGRETPLLQVIVDAIPTVTGPEAAQLCSTIITEYGHPSRGASYLAKAVAANPGIDAITLDAMVHQAARSWISGDKDKRPDWAQLDDPDKLGWLDRRRILPRIEMSTVYMARRTESWAKAHASVDLEDLGSTRIMDPNRPRVGITARSRDRTPVVGPSAAAADKVARVKERYAEIILSFDTCFDAPALLDRDFAPMQALLEAFVAFDDATRTGDPATQDHLASRVEEALNDAVAQARAVGLGHLTDSAARAAMFEQAARREKALSLAHDPAATPAEAHAAAAAAAACEEAVITDLASRLGAPAMLAGHVALPSALRQITAGASTTPERRRSIHVTSRRAGISTPASTLAAR